MILGIKIEVKIADIVSSLKDQESSFCQNQAPLLCTCCKRLSPSRDCIWSSDRGRSGPPYCGCRTSRQTSHTRCQGGSRTPWCWPAGVCPSPRTPLTPQSLPLSLGQARNALKSRFVSHDMTTTFLSVLSRYAQSSSSKSVTRPPCSSSYSIWGV